MKKRLICHVSWPRLLALQSAFLSQQTFLPSALSSLISYQSSETSQLPSLPFLLPAEHRR